MCSEDEGIDLMIAPNVLQYLMQMLDATFAIFSQLLHNDEIVASRIGNSRTSSNHFFKNPRYIVIKFLRANHKL